jgi:hypothetical protein
MSPGFSLPKARTERAVATYGAGIGPGRKMPEGRCPEEGRLLGASAAEVSVPSCAGAHIGLATDRTGSSSWISAARSPLWRSLSSPRRG